MQEVNPVVQSTQAPDRASKNKTIYDVSTWEIFWRNLVAGMGRALGSILLYLIFIFVLSYVFSLLIWPSLKPMVDSYMGLVDSLQNVPNPSTFDTGDINQLLDSYGIGQ